MAFATIPVSGPSFQDAIRSIALDELSGSDVSDRTRRLAGATGVNVSTIQVQVAEAVDLLAN